MNSHNSQNEINSVVWRACDTFRGAVDPYEYKNYILTMLFIKYISDLWLDKRAEYDKKYNGDQIRVDRAMSRERFRVPPESSFQYLYNNREAPNIGEIIKEYGFIIDATDNFAAKFLVSDACYFEMVPYSHAGVLQFSGQLITVLPGETACYRCIFNSPPPPNAVPSPSQVGVLGVIPGVIGSLQATEAIKYLDIPFPATRPKT